MLRKHREFLGESWFMYHLADTFLAYIGSKPNKIRHIIHAMKQCGVTPVTRALLDKVRRRMHRLMWVATEFHRVP
jgi:hypothetical protein